MIADDQYKLYEAGRFNDTPILVGYNSDEGASFSPPRTPEEYIANVKKRYGPFAERLVKAYPAGSGTVPKTARDLARDAAFGWHTWVWARLQAKNGKSKAFYYYFDQHPEYPEGSPRAGYGSPHGADVAYVFQHLRSPRVTKADLDISEAMATYWMNFAKTRRSEWRRVSRVAGFQRRQSRRDVLRTDAAYGTGAQRRSTQGPGCVFLVAADA